MTRVSAADARQKQLQVSDGLRGVWSAIWEFYEEVRLTVARVVRWGR